MSLAIDLTNNQMQIEKGEREASALLRRYKAAIPPEVYTELQLKLMGIASEATKFKINLGVLRMTGEMEQRPPAVTVETLELAGCMPPGVDRIHRMDGINIMTAPTRGEARQIAAQRIVPMLPEHVMVDDGERFALELKRSGDDTLKERAEA